MSLQELKALVEPLSADEKQILNALLQSEIASESAPSSEQDNWLIEHEAAALAALAAHPERELPTDLSQTWKQTRRARAQKQE